MTRLESSEEWPWPGWRVVERDGDVVVVEAVEVRDELSSPMRARLTADLRPLTDQDSEALERAWAAECRCGGVVRMSERKLYQDRWWHDGCLRQALGVALVVGGVGTSDPDVWAVQRATERRDCVGMVRSAGSEGLHAVGCSKVIDEGDVAVGVRVRTIRRWMTVRCAEVLADAVRDTRLRTDLPDDLELG